MGDMAASRHGFGPAIIAHQVRCEEFELAVINTQPVSHLGFAAQIADASVDGPTFGNQLPDEETCDITASA